MLCRRREARPSLLDAVGVTYDEGAGGGDGGVVSLMFVLG